MAKVTVGWDDGRLRIMWIQSESVHLEIVVDDSIIHITEYHDDNKNFYISIPRPEGMCRSM